MTRLLQPIAGVAVADGQRKKAKPDGQHDNVHHLFAPDGAQIGPVSIGTAPFAEAL